MINIHHVVLNLASIHKIVSCSLSHSTLCLSFGNWIPRDFSPIHIQMHFTVFPHSFLNSAIVSNIIKSFFPILKKD